MKQKNFFLATVIALITLLTMVGCAQSAPVYAQGTEKDNAVAAAAPLTQDMLDGIQKNVFQRFRRVHGQSHDSGWVQFDCEAICPLRRLQEQRDCERPDCQHVLPRQLQADLYQQSIHHGCGHSHQWHSRGIRSLV